MHNRLKVIRFEEAEKAFAVFVEKYADVFEGEIPRVVGKRVVNDDKQGNEYEQRKKESVGDCQQLSGKVRLEFRLRHFFVPSATFSVKRILSLGILKLTRSFSFHKSSQART